MMRIREFMREGADLERAALVQVLRSEDELRTWWYGSMEDLNPDARGAWERGEMRRVYLYGACIAAIVLFVVWVSKH